MISNPNKPNPDQLQHIHPKNSPANPARYDYEAPAAQEELKTQGPTIVLHPNAVYLVDPEAAAKRRDTLEEVVGGGEEEGPLILSSLDPDELPVWAHDTEVLFKGENFSSDSKIIWNGGQEPTTFIDASTISTMVKPSTVQIPPPVVIEAYVVDGERQTAPLSFTFIA